jgi:hypothetical protein
MNCRNCKHFEETLTGRYWCKAQEDKLYCTFDTCDNYTEDEEEALRLQEKNKEDYFS